MDVTVITPSLPDRSDLLAQCVASVASQSHPPAEHLIGFDRTRSGPAAIRSRLLNAVTTDWVAFVDDDDLLDEDHIETLMAHAAGVEVVIPHCRFDGPPLPPKFVNQPFDRQRLARHGIFPITVIARTDEVQCAGGFRPEDRYEDWSLWNRMADQGCRFEVVPQVTWTYRTGHKGRRTNAA